ncbi:hypothetical protein SCHPADRAFT_911757 [Schizopora paradoxa]|uniref:Uncharacterized protein n=1 Tax=Schizopora paradoxa TaxID=27342 RepID=A0A0H2R3Y7_9AGAM|nr:hypothetical protein SCHPADRAFT_911757 [Schizopora paradoxa]
MPASRNTPKMQTRNKGRRQRRVLTGILLPSVGETVVKKVHIVSDGPHPYPNADGALGSDFQRHVHDVFVYIRRGANQPQLSLLLCVKRHKLYGINEQILEWTEGLLEWKGKAFAVPLEERGGFVDFVNYEEVRHFGDIMVAMTALAHRIRNPKTRIPEKIQIYIPDAH